MKTNRVIGTVALTGLAVLYYDWLGKLPEKNPKAIRHHVVQVGGDRRLVLTADTAELQRFVLKHLKTEDAWKEVLKLHPVRPFHRLVDERL